MADLGAIQQLYVNRVSNRAIPVWRDLLTNQDYLSIDVTDTMAVTVNVDSSPLSYANVFLYYRNTGRIVDSGKTNKSGVIIFYNLDSNDIGGYFAVARHPTLNYMIYAHL